MTKQQPIITVILMVVGVLQIFAASPFPETVILTYDSESVFATDSNYFSPDNPYGVGQDLRGQCTWYVYGRVIELVGDGYIAESVKIKMEAAFDTTDRHAKNWDTLLLPLDNWVETDIEAIPYEDRKVGKIVIWDTGEFGHVAFVEEVSTDKSQYRISEFNWNTDTLSYRSDTWLPFYGDDSHGFSVSPKFYDLELAVLNKPDNIVINENLSTTSLAAGRTLTASCTVKNQGFDSDDYSFLGFYLSQDAVYEEGVDKLLVYTKTNALYADGTENEIQILTIPPETITGQWHIIFYTDRTYLLNEIDEGNNFKAIPFQVTSSAPDNIILNEALSKTSTVPGGTVTASCTVKNQGGNANSYSLLGFYLSQDTNYDEGIDLFLAHSTTGTLTANGTEIEEKILTIPIDVSSGQWYIIFYTDRTKLIAESSETNNCEFVGLQVATSTPDNIILSENLSTTTIAAGSALSASCTVKNQGNDAIYSSSLGYYLSQDTNYSKGDDIILGYTTTSTLAQDQTEVENNVITIPGNVAAGQWYIMFNTDRTNALSETDENNNYEFVPVQITAPALIPTIQIIYPQEGEMFADDELYPDGYAYDSTDYITDVDVKTNGDPYVSSYWYSGYDDVGQHSTAPAWTRKVDLGYGFNNIYVKAKDNYGNWSVINSTTCWYIAAPDNVNASGGSYDDHIHISWTIWGSHPDYINLYKVYRGLDSDPTKAVELFTGWTEDMFWDDYEVEPNIYYYYFVKLMSHVTESKYSSSVSGWITPPPSPENVNVFSDTANNEVNIDWDDAGINYTYEVYSSNDPYNGFVVDSSGNFYGSSWIAPMSLDKKFYYVRTVTGTKK